MLTFGPKVPQPNEAWIHRHPNVVFFSVCVITGVLLGFGWHSIVRLPSYTLGDDMTAVIREYGLAQILATDVWFTVLGFFSGIGIGILGWLLFKEYRWVSVAVAVFGGLLTAAICWQVGVALGPTDFATRISTALPGEQVQIDFQLHAYIALLVWPFGAVLPVLIGSAFSSTNELQQPDA